MPRGDSLLIFDIDNIKLIIYVCVPKFKAKSKTDIGYLNNVRFK